VAASTNDTVALAVADAHRREWAFVLAATVRVTGDLNTAEEAVQDAYERALETWADRGIPDNPGAWLTTTARRRALDLLRRAEVARRALPKLVQQSPSDSEIERVNGYPDDRLRLIFTCCHPSLSEEARVAITLRLVAGLSTDEVARAFLVPTATMAARIMRAKQKITGARIPYAIPDRDALPERVDAVLTVLHLLYASGHTAGSGELLSRIDLAERAIDLAAMLKLLLPDDPDVTGLLALLTLTEARRPAREAPDGSEILLQQQDRSLWDRAAIERGIALLTEAVDHQRPGRFTVMAAIAAAHDHAASWHDTDWVRIVELYDYLAELWPSPVVALNRAIALGFARGPADGLRELEILAADPRLARYPYLCAARADVLARLDRLDEAVLAYDEAIILSDNAAERASLILRRERIAP
jgi:RNA polymerase sigma-70 factor (ECF subfamily)